MKSYQTSSILCTFTNKSWLLISNVNLDLSITDIMSPWCTNLNLTYFKCWLLANENSSWLYGNPTFTSWNPTFQFGIQLFPQLDSWSPTLKTLVWTLPWVNPLPKNKILDMTKLKAFADEKLNIVKMMISLLDRVENTLGKGENAVYQHFLLFP